MWHFFLLNLICWTTVECNKLYLYINTADAYWAVPTVQEDSWRSTRYHHPLKTVGWVLGSFDDPLLIHNGSIMPLYNNNGFDPPNNEFDRCIHYGTMNLLDLTTSLFANPIIQSYHCCLASLHHITPCPYQESADPFWHHATTYWETDRGKKVIRKWLVMYPWHMQLLTTRY